ncbi:hypothetical protein VHA01S_010_00260 [Vibrio halioticoli NBRC 102217]|uniref:DUF945 domain-containing protein n=1 Tax=Vibrio halioticoli NBRC 102217 TaxID=1219072 RepID=V5HHA9_9VIBR|nr:DUF945 family protein [Vibrio halioticoli]GAD88800.1 hypothetical protein VHA01S_010_00260 [Vibrio halioticoli NBRC 102217]
MKQLKLMAAAGGAIAIVGIWPLAVGQIGQTILTDGVKNFSNSDVKVELEEYHRGYFTSEAKTLVTVTDPQALAQLQAYGWPTQYEFVHVIHHGLVSITGETSYAQNPALVLNTKTQLNGNTEFSTEVKDQQFEVNGAAPMKVLLESLSLNGSVSVLGQIDYQLNMPSVELDYQSGSMVRLSGLASKGDGKVEQELWLGEQTVSVDSFVIDDNEGVNLLEVNGFNYQFQTSEDETADTLQGEYQLAVKDFKNHDGEAANLNLNFTAGGFDRSSFLDITQMYQSTPQWTHADTEKVLPKVDALLAKGFTLSLSKFNVDIDEGHFETNWKLDLPAGSADSSKDMLQLLNLFKGNLNAFVSSDLVMAYPFIQQNLDELLIMEVATQTDDGYSLSLQLDDGNIKFANGKEVPVVSLLAPMLMHQVQ